MARKFGNAVLVSLTQDFTSSSDSFCIQRAALPKILWPGYRLQKNISQIKSLMQH